MRATLHKWTMVTAFVIAPVMATTALAQGVTDARPMSLDEAVRLAQLNQPGTVQARNQVRNNETALRARFFQLGYIPTLSINANSTQRGGARFSEGVRIDQGSTTPWSHGRGLALGNITLFDGGQRLGQYRSAQANVDASEAGIVTARYNVALLVKTAYYSILSARERRAAAQRQLETAQQQLQIATAKMNAGSATRTDSLSAAIAVGTARQAILTADNDVANANAQLTRYAATSFSVTALDGDTTSVTPLGLDEAELMRLALAGPLVTQNLASVKVAEAGRRVATAPLMPQVSMNGGYGWTFDNTPNFAWNGSNGNNYSLGFNVSYAVWDNYAREQNIANSRTTLENAEATLKDNRFGVQQQLTQQINTFRTAMLSIELNQLQIIAAEENVRVVQQQYNLGTRQLLDLMTAQNSLDAARTNLITSRQNARIAKANIEQIIGRDLR